MYLLLCFDATCTYGKPLCSCLSCKGNREARRQYFESDEGAQMWCARCWRVQPLSSKTQMANQRCHIQVSFRLTNKNMSTCFWGYLLGSKLFIQYLCVCSPLFRIINYTPDLKKSDVDRAIRTALNVWSEVTPLTFKKLYKGNADIMISFGSRGLRISIQTIIFSIKDIVFSIEM